MLKRTRSAGLANPANGMQPGRVCKEQARQRGEHGRSLKPLLMPCTPTGRAAALQRGAGGAACGGGGAARGAPAAAAAALAPAVVPAAAVGRRGAPPRAARAAGPGARNKRPAEVHILRVGLLVKHFCMLTPIPNVLLSEQLDQVRQANISSSPQVHRQCRFMPYMRSLLPVPGQEG